MLHHMARCGGLCKIVAIEIIIRKPAPAATLPRRRPAPASGRRLWVLGCGFAA
jgi:hypothetical protein